jgi:hypothetical protein
MLAVFRIPLMDFRPFAVDEEIYHGVRLPGSWSDGQFVRGTGIIRRRPRRSVIDWPAERTYADFRNSVRLQSQSVENLNSRLESIQIDCIHRRLWYALPEIYCLFDYDFVAPFRIRANSITYDQRQSKPSLLSLTRVPTALSESLVSVGPWSRGEDPPRTTIGKVSNRLAKHFAVATATSATRDISARFVEAGRPVMTIEGTGTVPTLDLAQRIERYKIEDVEVLGFSLPISGARHAQCYCIFSRDSSRASSRKTRELRIHLLRLHSIHEFLARLTNRAVINARGPWGLATERSAAYDRLQQAIIEIYHTLRRAELAEIGSTPNLLSAAFLAHEFITNYSLQVLERRLLSSVRPAVLRKLRQLADEERERAQLDKILNAQRDRSGVLTIIGRGARMTKYEVHGGAGAVGDNASASNFALGEGAQVLTIDGHNVDRFKLVAELRHLQESIAQSETQDAETNDAQRALSEAEDAAKAGNGERVKASLAKLGRWVLRLAEATGAAVAGEEIRRAAGL